MSDIQVNVKVDAKEADTSLKGLKKELKELRDAQANVAQGSGEWKKLAKQINDVEGQLGDLNDSFTTLRGSGIERVNASIGLLGEGFRNFDTEKIKIGFQGVGAAMKAIPIFLIAEGLRLLIENFEEVTKFFKQFFDVASEGERNLKKLNKELEQTQQQNNILTKAIDSQIKVLEAQGASEERILALKAKGNQLRIKELEQQQAINKAKLAEALANDSVTDSLLRVQIATLRKVGKDKEADALERAIFQSRLNENKELVKAIEETALAINEVKTNQNIEEIKFEKQKQKDLKKIREDATKDRENELKESQRLADELFAQLSKNQDVETEQIMAQKKKEKEAAEKQAKELAEIDRYWKDWAAKENEKAEAEAEERRKKAEADFKASEAAKVEAARSSLDAARGLSEAFFAFQLNAAEGNAAKELEIRKKMFAVDKAFNVARAIQDGIRSVQAALTVPPPGGPILAVVNGTIAAANVAKILATKFNAGSSTPSASVNTSTPNVPNTSTPTPQQAALPGQDGTFIKPDNKVYVLESDITKTQDRVARVGEQAKF